MNILVPLNSMKNIAPYVQAGADEFYMGFYDQSWFDTFGEYSDINRMSGFKNYANSFSFDELLTAAAMIKEAGRKAFVTLNANTYSREQIDYISDKYLQRLSDAGIDGVIISTCGIALAAKECGLNPVASTMLSIYNTDIAKYMIDIGINRIILPRDLTLDEIAAITAAFPQVEFEAFFLRNGCVFSDGYCLGMHREECGSTCGYVKRADITPITYRRSFDDRHAMNLNSLMYNGYFHKQACGLCALFRFSRIGISSLKIVGRADPSEQVLKDIGLTKRNLEIIETCETESDFLERMEMPQRADIQCLMGLSCYYPEVRFK